MNPTAVIRPTGTVSDEQARRLLRRIRDLNLGPAGIEVSDHGRVVVDGCLSIDAPVEGGVRYRLQDGGVERLLLLCCEGSLLRIRLGSEDSGAANELGVQLSCDGLGRVSALELGARLHLEQAGARDIEHFLRRIVRAVYARVEDAA